MPAIGFNINAIDAKVDPTTERKGNVNVNSSPSITSIEKRDVDFPLAKDVVAINFKFETKYEPKVGWITMEGEVLYTSDNPKEMIAKWKKEKKMEDDVAIEVLNTIFRRCLAKAIEIAAELRLPPPVSFPIVKLKDQEEYIG
ncbi:MAG: hypothetical protein HYU56_05575 [Candidatus Aenigmarchaeota archaeon]|nr:hypothetical protein [Candidatus Aenigmarchaeota archaeon]